MFDVIVIGGGPAGMTAALYAKRASKQVLVIEKSSFGGQIASSPKVENYPSIKEISGLDLSNNMFEQIMELGVELECDEVQRIEQENDYFVLHTPYNTFDTKSVIIATGLTHKRLNGINLDKFEGNGISYCAVCDGAFYSGKDVAVIGDANTALQYAIMLSQLCKSVTLCMLFDRFFADEILVEKIKTITNIKVLKQIELQEYIGEDKLESLLFKHTVTNETIQVKVEGCFVAIGLEPHNEIFKDFVDLDERGFIISNEGITKTKGIYAAGDATKKTVRQVTTAIGDGATSAIQAVNYLNKK